VPLTDAATGAAGRTSAPLFVLGLSGRLKHFMMGVGAGFWASFYDCKNGYAYGAPEALDFLHPSLSGVCLGNIINTCFHVGACLAARVPAPVG
jgi:hypothetical protein